jgi:hypothetical protein
MRYKRQRCTAVVIGNNIVAFGGRGEGVSNAMN